MGVPHEFTQNTGWGGRSPSLGGPENGKKFFEKILKFFQVPQLSAPECWNAETPYLGPNGFAGSKFGQGEAFRHVHFRKNGKDKLDR